MKNTILESNVKISNTKKIYRGKVRDVITTGDNLMVMTVTDRISCFDTVLPKGIPYKGQVLNQLASLFLEQTEDILPNWKIFTPDPNVMIGYACRPFKIEMVVRGYLAGHAWREYQTGKRILCGVELPEGMKENDKFPKPIVTPTTKVDVGHDEDISREDILEQGLVSEKDYDQLHFFSKLLFDRGTKLAADKGLILVDTKYEFGKRGNNEIMLIDEIHTPDSSRYFYVDGYKQRQKQGEPQEQLSKEFVRQWLMNNGFQGKRGQSIPEMDDYFIDQVSKRYIELYEILTGKLFVKADITNIDERIEKNIGKVLTI